MTGAGEPLLQVRDLRVHFGQRRSLFSRSAWSVRAVDGVSLEIRRGETLGLVGESGCGKSTVGRAVAHLLKPSSGTIRFRGEDLGSLDRTRRRSLRRDLQIIFQDPYSSLDPRMRIGAAIREPLTIHGIARGEAARLRVLELLDSVGLPASAVDRYPHEFSGGQRQRIAIARALALEPELIVCDEPISALDVSVQAQIVNLLGELQERRQLTYLFIAHDLAVVRHISHRIAVMYLGRIVETGPSEILCGEPLHPYTKALFGAVPRANPKVERNSDRPVIQGEIPSPLNPPGGCHFHTRCPYARDICRTRDPSLESVGTDRGVACHFWKEIKANPVPNACNRTEAAL
ncbi:ABC transporter ATP-binding protein [Nitratireductor pacificus]|uniref:Peptide ABC transporter ATPase n=1 Tax=Nitratireductor pacificus pht-3B TaxID=391937 RepID=K2MCT9_9HYPH|nr:ABC transporter ATP-binding protein [Nitratireductor pacificus]EKF18570.1 peptide ABC transporter ATPase [Nitratireductor pacificus pht-3B]